MLDGFAATDRFQPYPLDSEPLPELAIAVLPTHQGRGFGSALLERILQRATGKVRGVALSCLADNLAARKLYQQFGFVVAPHSIPRNRNGVYSLTMTLMLDKGSIVIRQATQEDLDIVYNLIREKAAFDQSLGDSQTVVLVTLDSLRGTLFNENPYAHVLLATSDDRILGLALYHFRFSSFRGQPSLWLDDLFVRETYRNQGTGLAFMHELAAVAHTHGCSHLSWTAHARNTRGLVFYARIGAVVTEQREQQCYLTWEPKLQPPLET